MRADLAFAGFGHAGQRFAALLDEKREILLRDHDLDARIVGIVTRRHGSAFGRGGLDVPTLLERIRRGVPLAETSPASEPPASVGELIRLLATSDAPVRVLVEVTTLDIQNGQPAIAHVEAALAAGCHVITANKGPAAFAYRALQDRATAAGVSFLFEGAVMDGVPIFNLVRETLPAVRIDGFRGVVNTTTNYILTAMEEGRGFADALAAMQAAGIAEADPSLDVEGWDAAAKTAALANVLLDAGITPRDVDRTGIGPDTAAPARAAKASGRRLKLVSSASRRRGGGASASVKLEELPSDDVLSSADGLANVLVLGTDLLGSIAIHQLGGNLTMTAYALLSDLVAVSNWTHRRDRR